MKIDRESFKELLKEKGLKMTRQRLVVLEVLAENPEQHLTAEDIYEKHTVISEFLKSLGVPEETASVDACKIEHIISDETFLAVKKFLGKK